MQPARGTYGTGAGLRLLAGLPESGVFRTRDALQVAHGLGITETHARKLLSELSASGWLRHVQRGLYAPVDRATREARAHPFTVATALVEPSAVSHWSALSHWGLSEQLPRYVTVSSPRRSASRSRRRRTRDKVDGLLWSAGDDQVRVVFIRESHYFGLVQEWVAPTERVWLFDKERALLDAFRHFHVFGSVTAGLDMLEQHVADLDLDRLVTYTERLGVGSVSHRLGWALERLDVPVALRERLARGVRRGAHAQPLDPTRPERGRRDHRWALVENLDASGR